MHDTPPPTDHPQRMLTLSGGGWVAVVAALLCLAVLVWAMWAPLMRMVHRPPGDGQNVETYGFDLTTLTIPRDTFVPVMLHRDMPPRWDHPPTMTVEEHERRTEEERGKYLVSTDRVVGITINGESRAYPISVLTVHEVINDELGGVPIAVTYSWLGDAVRVFDRRVGDETLEFGVSGLVHNANLLMYDRRPAQDEDGETIPWEKRGESLWSQLLAEPVSGPATEAQHVLTTIPAQLVSWQHWTEMQPGTTVIERDPMLIKRYRRATPTQYFRQPDIPYPVDPLPEHGPGWKERVVAIVTDDVRKVYPVALIAEQAMPRDDLEARYRAWDVQVGGHPLTLVYEPATETVSLLLQDTAMHSSEVNEETVDWVHCFWFTWYAMHPADALAGTEYPDKSTRQNVNNSKSRIARRAMFEQGAFDFLMF